jgi:hypothetical protein
MSVLDVVHRYMGHFDAPEDAQKLIRFSWEVAEFPLDELREQLYAVANVEMDDFTEILRGDNLLNASLALIGFPQSFGELASALQEGDEIQEKVARVVSLFRKPRRGYLVSLREHFAQEYPDEEFPCMMAESAILLCRSREFLRIWEKAFRRLADEHPSAMRTIADVVGIAMRGEALQVDSIRWSHRMFADCQHCFERLLDEDKGEAECGEIWRRLRERVLVAMELE